MTSWAFDMRFGRPLALLAAIAVAAVPPAAFAQSQSDEDEENPTTTPETPATTPATPATAPGMLSPTATPPGTAKPKAPGAAEAAKPATPLGVNQGYLEGRAEVESPNEEIDTIQKKTYKAANRFEVTVYPGALQLNSKFVNADGVALGVDYAVQENFALQVLALYNYIGSWTPLTGELYDNHARPEAADQLLLQGGFLGGFEVAPIYGKFAFYNGTLAQFRFVLNAGAGVGFTQVQLSGSTEGAPGNATTYASTGARFLGNLGVGFRVLLGERFALRLEIRDLLYTARVDSIDGCNAQDLNESTIVVPGGPAPSSGCNKSVFEGANGAQTTQQKTELFVAQKLVGDNSSDVVNNIIFFAGLSYLF
jgi:outer membrane beta-barrel protein